MEIKNANLKFSGSFTKRKRTDAIILHHAAAKSCTVEAIHSWHLQNMSGGVPWLGIGYHYVVRKDGSVWQGRPDDVVGAHAGTQNGYNTHSVGICFEGDYEQHDKTIPEAQFKEGIELIRYLLDKYPGSKILTHKDVSPTTSCPGRYFPVDKLKAIKVINPQPVRQTQTEADLDILVKAGIVESPKYWLENAMMGKIVRGDYAAGLIHNVAEYVRGK